ncbi:uncharacterized protein PFL1_06243 [Pseudozyma flocculosa PF-1]|uniref:Uncharacterized protein n=2 Tax=Pseudozyma flocculosa TaxID=84751 RepID=A0A5C3FAF1_9BASI|nr:uncharacterized protein PFL1_06243 [Pseudozyma flocculosa PF-1]EPQ26308.1 hypothetical protein PFL1_06243 [Pseudozyma flocculosa PF-1]SPO40269.1 uncharacterized protein PSFLO_05751 [Pseudozyma flocculosa]
MTFRLACAWLACLACLLALQARALEQDVDTDGSAVNPAISSTGSSGYGWTALPTVAGARIDNKTVVVGENATLLHYIDADYDPQKIKRVVIQVHGDSRDAWNQWLYADLAAKRAAQGGTVKREEVLVVAPEFFEKIDLGAYPFIAQPRLKEEAPPPAPASGSVTDLLPTAAATSPARNANAAAKATRSASNISLAPRSAAPPAEPLLSAAASPPAGHSHASSPGPGPAPSPANRTEVLLPPDPRAIIVSDTTEYFSASQAMIFDGTSWGDGSPALNPLGNGAIGAFEALDELLAYFLDESRFPALNRVVLAGFSLGGQLVQRYAAFRPDTSDDARTTFWVSSPNSFVYFNDTRPLKPKKACRNTYNDYKYGLEGELPPFVTSRTASPDAIVERFMGRDLVYLCGVRDKMPGSDDCPSNTQGSHHVSKMVYWTERVVPYLAGAPGNGTLPAKSSVYWIAKTGHEDWKIITSDPGVYSLFLQRYNDDGTDAAAPPSNGVTATDSPTDADNGALAGIAAPSRAALLVLALVASALVVA